MLLSISLIAGYRQKRRRQSSELRLQREPATKKQNQSGVLFNYGSFFSSGVTYTCMFRLDECECARGRERDVTLHSITAAALQRSEALCRVITALFSTAAGNVARGEPRVHLPQSTAQLLVRFPYVNIFTQAEVGHLVFLFCLSV